MSDLGRWFLWVLSLCPSRSGGNGSGLILSICKSHSQRHVRVRVGMASHLFLTH